LLLLVGAEEEGKSWVGRPTSAPVVVG